MKYRKLIEDYFLIDKAGSGELVPFKFNKAQVKYYADLVTEYDIEKQGITAALRENIVKARREGFSSLILALFAADDIAQENPTESLVISYKDDATQVFRRRYRTYILSFFARKKLGSSVEEIKNNPGLLDKAAKRFLSIDGSDIILKHNRAHFYCGTASARVGGRGGDLQKLLFSEVAYYPDTEKMTAREIVEGTLRQIDIDAGWVFCESTENGRGTYQYQMWTQSKKGLNRFRNRFYGAKEFYSDLEIKKIRSEYVDMDMFRKDYPMSEDDLFKSSEASFCSESELYALINNEHAGKEIAFWCEITGTNYIDQCEILLANIEVVERQYPKNSLYAGIDTAKHIDKTVLFILKDRRKSVEGGIRGVAIDSTGHGDFVPDWFKRNSRWYILPISFSRPVKDIMYKNLMVVIKDKKTSIPILIDGKEYVSPEAEHFETEMLSLEKKIVGNLIVVAHPNGDEHHDDYPDSWCLAEHMYTVINGVDKRMKPAPSLSLDSSIKDMLNRRNKKHNLIDEEYE